jgi:hypothetical protein
VIGLGPFLFTDPSFAHRPEASIGQSSLARSKDGFQLGRPAPLLIAIDIARVDMYRRLRQVGRISAAPRRRSAAADQQAPSACFQHLARRIFVLYSAT